MGSAATLVLTAALILTLLVSSPARAGASEVSAGSSSTAQAPQGAAPPSRTVVPPPQGVHIEGPLAPGFSPAQSTTGPACEKRNKEGKCVKEYATPLKYRGGPVQHTPKLYLIFWGSNWSKTEEGISRHGNLLNTYGGLTTEYGFNLTYQHILSQYSDRSGPITENGVTIAADYIYEGSAAPQGVSHKTIEAEVEYAIEQNKWPRGPESQFVVLQPAGTAYEPAFVKEEEKPKAVKSLKVGCGYHREDSHGDVYGFVPDLENKLFVEVQKCQNYDLNEKNEPYWKRILTMVASHEYAEAVTDPDGADPNGANPAWTNENGFEIADICDEAPTLVNEALGIWVTRLWGNHEAKEKGVNEGCVIKDPPEPKPPAPTAITDEASNVGATSATLNGSVNPNGPPETHYYFEYGETTVYGSDSPAPPGTDAGYGESAVPASTTITALQPSRTYHYRIVASSWVGTTDGVDQTFRTAGWTIQSTQNPHGLGESDWFSGVSCWSATGCDAVGSNSNSEDEIVGLVERWNGSTWEVQSTPKSTGAQEDNLESVSCRSASECEATGYAEVAEGKHITLAERWNGTAWSIQSTPTEGNDSDLVSVSCASASECVASGLHLSGSPVKHLPLVESWNGKEWKVLTTATLPKEDEQSWLESVSCPSAKDCTAVGSVHTKLYILPLVETYNGSTWTVQSTPTLENSLEARLSGVSCSATSACTAVGWYDNATEKGDRALVERYNGTSWQLQETASPVAKPAPEGSHWTLAGVSCPTSSSCVTVGSYAESASGKNLLLGEEWNGSRWELAQPVDRTTGLYDEARGVSCSAALTCTLAGLTQKENYASETLAERMEP